MSDDLAKKQWVIVMSNSLIGYVDDDVVEDMKQSLSRGLEMIELPDGSLVQTKNISILSPEAYNIFSKHQRGMWKCRYNQWHNRDEHCECGRY